MVIYDGVGSTRDSGRCSPHKEQSELCGAAISWETAEWRKWRKRYSRFSVKPLYTLFATLLLLTSAGAAPEPRWHAIESAGYADPRQYGFLNALLGDVEVVSLAESIHMTHEFPLIRIGMVRYLNENLGFHTVALEGSPEDLWVTQDQFLASPDTGLSQAMAGVFGLWNTPEMAQLFRYEAASWSTAHPLYLTAYDIQPGMGSGTEGPRVLQMLVERLKSYSPPPPDFDEGKWLAATGRLTSSCSGYQPSEDALIDSAIGSIEQWIIAAAPKVQQRFPNVPHAALLRLVPANLRASLSLCQVVGSGRRDWRLYKRTRDRLAARFALTLKTAAPGGKLMLWAHISHLFYDDSGKNTSVGEILHSLLGPKLYTLATFALGGGTIVLFDDTKEDIGYAFVRGNAGTLKNELDQRCRPACFVDMRGTTDKMLLTTQPVWFEAGIKPMIPAKNFDGIVWVHDIHPPGIPLGTLLDYSVVHYRWQLAGAALAIVLAFVLCGGLLLHRRSK